MAVRAWHKDRSATLNAVEQLRGSACPNAYARTWQPDQPDRGPAGWWPRSQGKQTNRSSVRLVWQLASFTGFPVVLEEGSLTGGTGSRFPVVLNLFNSTQDQDNQDNHKPTRTRGRSEIELRE